MRRHDHVIVDGGVHVNITVDVDIDSICVPASLRSMRSSRVQVAAGPIDAPTPMRRHDHVIVDGDVHVHIGVHVDAT